MKGMSIQRRNKEIHLICHPNEGTCQVRIMPSNEREPFFFVGGLKNFFISTPYQKKSRDGRVHVMKIKNDSMWERSLLVLVKVRTTPTTKYLVLKGFIIVEVILLDLE